MKKLALLLLALAFAAASAPSQAADFPVRKIDIILPYGPGSGTDVTARALAPSLSEALGVPVVVQNVDGSGGLRGMEFAAKQPADGYTIFMCTPTHILSQIQSLSSVALTKNFDPLACLVQDSTLVTAKKGGRVAGLSPKGIDAISMRMIAKAAGIELTFIPFGSGAEATSALLGGHVDLNNEGPADALEMIKGEEKIALLVASDKRLSGLPDVPTTIDEGLEVVTGPWRALCVPKGTPPELVKILEEGVRKAFNSPQYQDWLRQMMLDQRPGWKNSEELGAMWTANLDFFEKAFKDLGL